MMINHHFSQRLIESPLFLILPSNNRFLTPLGDRNLPRSGFFEAALVAKPKTERTGPTREQGRGFLPFQRELLPTGVEKSQNLE